MEEKSLKNAKKVYETLCGALDSIGWRYERHDDDFIVTLGVNGEDIPMWLVIGVDADKELIRCMSRIPVAFDSENMVDGSIACAYATWRIIDGRFVIDISKGEVNFEISSSFALYSSSDISLKSKAFILFKIESENVFNELYIDISVG